MQDSEKTIHCAEINATLYERAACFLEMKQKNQNGQLGLLLDSLTTKLVKPHPLNQSILLTQGRIQEIFMKNIENWRSWKMRFKKMLHLNENMQPIHMKYHLFLHYVSMVSSKS